MDQKQSVEIIRSTHEQLRKQLSKDKNFDETWENHCKDESQLQQYAKAMENLATKVWEVDCDGTDRTEYTLKWCKSVLRSYYTNGGRLKLLDKDDRRKRHYADESSGSTFSCGPNPYCMYNDETSELKVDKGIWESGDKIRVLDVGSCYNPFRGADDLETTPIDLAPANPDVFKCDFVNVAVKDDTLVTKKSKNVNSEMELQVEGDEITLLPYAFYHAVVFSLLLTYIPCPKVRWCLCEKAHRLLATNGLLLIVAPDSCHQNRHAALMKEWKNAIESIGFQRTIYSKDTHLHLMAFRKVPSDFIWDKRKFDLDQNDIVKKLHIPQDFHGIDGSNVE
uniref:S-adenosylmethionine sensor upstream of mTORC1 n=1 Tax=Phallusia mammillata TaxID=59560 RepID=A0A6F9D6Z1_9ASCI|nr:uncharacterized protein LOC778832 [Phallusia mammillata]